MARLLPIGARIYSVEMDERNAAVAEKIIRLSGFDEDMVRRVLSLIHQRPLLHIRWFVEELASHNAAFYFHVN